jgi:tetratricopeptide (TPR) repeat protein/transglutaminase-like putative cysteine protease
MSKLRILVLLSALVGLAPAATAVDAPFHPDLTERTAELTRARGPESYAALRRIWATWDRTSPAHVEEALGQAERDTRLSPPARVYAGILGAFARLRRGDVAAARTRFEQLGFVDRWLVVGPFDNEGKSGLDTAHPPELELGSAIVPGRAYTGKERAVRYRPVPREFPYGFIDFGSLLRPEQKVCAYATTFVRSKEPLKAPRRISAWVGSGGAFKLFWNGKEVLKSAAYTPHDFDRRATLLELQPGTNQLVVKVCGDDTAPILSLRLGDATGGPDAGVEFSNDVTLSEEASALVQKLKDKPAPRLPVLEGPVQAFERITGKKDVKPSELEAYARYLAETDGDDPAVHLARDLAQRAAESEASIERYLLVTRLSEDQNRRNEWLTKAEALAEKRQVTDKNLLLARALQRRVGPNWREASPYFDRVLAIDPDNVLAMQGRVELYHMAGLPRTALSALERAVERNPNAVSLLNLYASQLRQLGRTTEAEEVEARYFALRFDDASFINQMLDLAVMRRDSAAAEHWAERLIASHPGDLWALATAARAYRSLGQSERAIATYRRALELAPEDVPMLRTLADLSGELGRRDEQLRLLREILRIRPQERDVREYVEHVEPEKPRADEAYAWSKERFLPLRHAPARGENRRTLRDLTVSTVFENGLSSQFRQVVFQPLTDAAAAQARQYGFVYEADRQIVQLRGAKIYRGDGKVDEAIEWGEGAADDPSISMYTSGRVFYVQFPRLEAGDVVELRYRIDDVTPRNDFNDYFGDIVFMQGTEPMQNAEYVLITPKSRTLYIDQRVPGLKQATTDSGNQRIYRFFADKVPPLRPEPAMPPLQETLGFVHVSTYKSWQDLGRWYWGLIKDQFDLDEETRRLARKITEGKKTDLEKVRAVYDWVTKNTRYVALEFGIYGFKPRRCVQTVSRGWGDCKDKATVIVTLLKELGIPSTMVVLRTQMKGDFYSTLPSFAPFDHAIAYVPSLDLYLDGTAEHTGISELPQMDLNAIGFLVNEGDAKLVRLPGAHPDRNFLEKELTAKLEQSGQAKLELHYKTSGYNAAQWRDRYHAESTRRERINHDIGATFPGFMLSAGGAGIETSNLEDAEAPVWVKVQGIAPTFARREGKSLIVPVTDDFRLTPAYASLSKRNLPVAISAFSELRNTYTIELPPGSKVVSMPQPVKVDGPFGYYSLEIEATPQKVKVQSKLGVKVRRVNVSDYAAWKQFCEAADRALGAPLVVEP